MDMSEQEIEQQNTVSEDNRMILRTENLVKKYGKRTVVRLSLIHIFCRPIYIVLLWESLINIRLN